MRNEGNLHGRRREWWGFEGKHEAYDDCQSEYDKSVEQLVKKMK